MFSQAMYLGELNRERISEGKWEAAEGPNTHILDIFAMPEMSTWAAVYNNVEPLYSSGWPHLITTQTRKETVSEANLKYGDKKKINSKAQTFTHTHTRMTSTNTQSELFQIVIEKAHKT